jgi:3-deoxy-D-manno-octulosonic-acid transferase
VIRLIYNLLFPIALALFLPGYFMKMRLRGNYRHKFGQRLGRYDAATRRRLRAHPRTWIHAVSVGEVTIALKIAAKLREIDPAFHAALTTTTTTGFAVASANAPEWIEVMYNPLDWWPVMRRAFAAIKPQRIALVEAEIWPNMVAIAHRRGVPLALVNARLSARSEQRFRRFNALVRPVFAQLDLVCVQEPADVERWSALGVARARIRQVGSVKFDVADAPPGSDEARRILRDAGFARETPVLFGGSTHDGEEKLLAQVWRALRDEFPQLKLVIAPRHVERAPVITATLAQCGLRVARRTRAQADENIDCLLLDTTGELRHCYSIATIVFIGKSITARGGQNPVEAITAGKPVLFGPHMENFQPLAAGLLRSGGAIEVRDLHSLAAAVRKLLHDPPARARLIENAHAVLITHRGATERTAALLRNLEPAGWSGR